MHRDSSTSDFMTTMIIAQAAVLSMCAAMFGILLWALI